MKENRPIAAFVEDIKQHFETARLTYLKGPGTERGTKGEEGVQPVLQDRQS